VTFANRRPDFVQCCFLATQQKGDDLAKITKQALLFYQQNIIKKVQ